MIENDKQLAVTKRQISRLEDVLQLLRMDYDGSILMKARYQSTVSLWDELTAQVTAYEAQHTRAADSERASEGA